MGLSEMDPEILERGTGTSNSGNGGKGEREGGQKRQLCSKTAYERGIEAVSSPCFKKHIDFKNIPVFYMYACLEMSFTVYK